MACWINAKTMGQGAVVEEIEEPDVFAFARENHEYRINGVIVHSVTQALRRAGLVRFWSSEEVLRKAMQRGRDVHMICADIDNNGPDYWSTGELSGYALAWQKFVKEFDFKPDFVEQRLYHTTHLYAGALDAAGFIYANSRSRRRFMVIERKTGSYSAWHKEQTAAYWLALPNLGIKNTNADRMAVYLRPNGAYTAKAFDSPTDVSSYLCALNVARTRTERKLAYDDESFDCIVAGGSATGFGIDIALSEGDDGAGLY